ncbi:MAG: hydantoinase/oxoprolinase family protein [Thermoleophilia bacterium]
MEVRRDVAGYDIGGANVKVVHFPGGAAGPRLVIEPYEIWRDAERLVSVLKDTAERVGVQAGCPLAVTMTAELADVFRTKREGVLFVLEAVKTAFPGHSVSYLDQRGKFVSARVAKTDPVSLAATNWIGSALVLARHLPRGILVDVGSTTTDIIAFQEGNLLARERTDSGRLCAGELVYSGVIRTNPNTVVSLVPWRGRLCRVAAEAFACMGDVYLLLGKISPDDYTAPTPDGRDVSLEDARGRIARLICADEEMVTSSEAGLLARYLEDRQLVLLSEALLQVVSGLSDRGVSPEEFPLVAAGTGAFLVRELGRRLGAAVVDEIPGLDPVIRRALPATATALLLAEDLERQTAGGWGSAV